MPTDLSSLVLVRDEDYGSRGYAANRFMRHILADAAVYRFDSERWEDFFSRRNFFTSRSSSYDLQRLARDFDPTIPEPSEAMATDRALAAVLPILRELWPDDAPHFDGGMRRAIDDLYSLAANWQPDGANSLTAIVSRRMHRHALRIGDGAEGTITLLGCICLAHITVTGSDGLFRSFPCEDYGVAFWYDGPQGERAIIVSKNGLVFDISHEVDPIQRQHVYRCMRISHLAAVESVVSPLIRSGMKGIFQMLRSYTDGIGAGRTVLGPQSFLTTPLSRRAGIDRRWFLRVFSRGDFGDCVREHAPRLPRGWREALTAEMSRVGAAPPRPRSRVWSWARIPAEVAEIMQRDLSLNLDDPTEGSR